MPRLNQHISDHALPTLHVSIIHSLIHSFAGRLPFYRVPHRKCFKQSPSPSSPQQLLHVLLKDHGNNVVALAGLA